MRNNAAVRLLHVLPSKSLRRVDLSDEIGLGTRSTALDELVALDEQRTILEEAAATPAHLQDSGSDFLVTGGSVAQIA